VVGLLGVGLLAGCSGDSDDGDASSGNRNGSAKVERDGDELTIQNDDGSLSIGDAELPDHFPEDEVPLPEGADLKAVVAGGEGDERYYSLTYSVSGDDLEDAADAYRAALRAESYRIEASSSAGASAATFRAFTAVGEEWDVIVYGGGTGSDGALSLQVTPHEGGDDPPDADVGSGSRTG
jgi:hypothetical protein